MHRLDPLCRGKLWIAGPASSTCRSRRRRSTSPIRASSSRIIGPHRRESSCSLSTLDPARAGRTTPIVHARAVLHRYRRGEATLEEVFAQQAEDLPRWGGGRYLPFYTTRLGTRAGTARVRQRRLVRNTRESSIRRRCSDAASPNTRRACSACSRRMWCCSRGAASTPSRSRSTRLLPHARTIPCLHFAHRKGRAAEEGEAARIRPLLIRRHVMKTAVFAPIPEHCSRPAT